MSFSAPKPPNPNQVAQAQQQYNLSAAKSQQSLNSYGQSTPFGSVSYVADPSSPSGYRVVTDTNQTGKTLLNTADTLANNSAGMYSTPFNAGTEVADKLNAWQAQYLAPIFKQQESNLEAQLRDQGLQPGTEAYNNAKNLLARNQGDVTTNYLTKNQQQAFDQALREYQTPLETIGNLRQNALPGAFQATPTVQMQPANYQGAVQSNYEQQMKNYENTWNGIGKLLGSGVSLAAAPFTGGTSLAGMFASGAGNAVGSALAPKGGYTGWTSGGWG